MSRLSGGSDWALLLSPEPPFPMTGGGALRTASICGFLSRYFRLHLVSFQVGEAQPLAQVGEVEHVDWISLPVHSKSVAARGARNAGRLARGVLPLTDRFCQPASRESLTSLLRGRQYRLAVLEHFWCAPYLDLIRRHADYAVLDLHNVESVLHARCAGSEGRLAGWGHRRFAEIAERQERELLPGFDCVLAASETDRDLVLQRAPRAQVAVYPNAIPLRRTPAVHEEHCIAFSGNFEYHPNVGAVRYFAWEVWPALRREDPQLRWRLIGKNDWAVRRWTTGDPRIECTGPLEDAVTELAKAKVVVVPLLAGSGTRIKILEAWAAGRAVVSTRIGAEGLPAVDGKNLLLADSPAELRGAILHLLRDSSQRQRLGQAGRSTVEKLCWPVVWSRLEENLAPMLTNANPAATAGAS